LAKEHGETAKSDANPDAINGDITGVVAVMCSSDAVRVTSVFAKRWMNIPAQIAVHGVTPKVFQTIAGGKRSATTGFLESIGGRSRRDRRFN
jgi:hypothetical protein